jgi:hypothetical protein
MWDDCSIKQITNICSMASVMMKYMHNMTYHGPSWAWPGENFWLRSRILTAPPERLKGMHNGSVFRIPNGKSLELIQARIRITFRDMATPGTYPHKLVSCYPPVNSMTACVYNHWCVAEPVFLLYILHTNMTCTSCPSIVLPEIWKSICHSTICEPPNT